MNTKETALTVTFTALAIVLTPIRIPSFYLPGVYYSFNEIPVVVAFLLLSPIVAISIAALKMITEIVVFPGPVVFVGRPLIFVLCLSMLLGIYVARQLLKRTPPKDSKSLRKPLLYYTAFGTLFRTIIAPILNYPQWLFIIPALTGIPVTPERALALVPAFMAFALTLSLYTIPASYLVARVIGTHAMKNLKPAL